MWIWLHIQSVSLKVCALGEWFREIFLAASSERTREARMKRSYWNSLNKRQGKTEAQWCHRIWKETDTKDFVEGKPTKHENQGGEGTGESIIYPIFESGELGGKQCYIEKWQSNGKSWFEELSWVLIICELFKWICWSCNWKQCGSQKRAVD